MPALEGLNSTYKDKGVQVVGVLLDSRNKDRAVNILQKSGADFINLLDDGTFTGKIFAVPQKYFVNSEGIVVYSILGGLGESNLKTIIDSLLEQ
jgi:hypothetical protein